MSYLREVELDPTFPPVSSLQKFFGFVPNLFRAQALLPRVIEAAAGINRAVLLEERALPRTQKESVLLAVAAAYGNAYCVTRSHHALRLLGVPDRQLDQIGIDHHQAGLSTADMALLDFALKLARNAPWLSSEDIAALRGHGWNDESILATALTNFLCTLSAGLGPLVISSHGRFPTPASRPSRTLPRTLAVLPDRTCARWN
jgi:uncharacterized peroxidase-related enzyme